MTYRQMQERAIRLTQQEVAALQRQVVEEYRIGRNAILRSVRRLYNNVLAGVDPTEWSRTVTRYGRLQTLLDSVTIAYLSAARKAGTIIRNTSALAMQNNYYRNQFATLFILSGDIRILPFLNEKLVELSVLGTEEAWQNIQAAELARIERAFGSASEYAPRYGTLKEVLTSNQLRDADRIRMIIRQGISQGILRGQSFDQARGALLRNLNGIFNTTASNVQRIIRTETHRTQSLGHYANYRASLAAGVQVFRQIIAVRDDGTRPQSVEVDGEVDRTGEGFLYPNGERYQVPGNTGVAAYDINDRERVIQMVPGVPPTQQRARNPVTGRNEVMSFRDFDVWAREKGLRRNRYGALLPV